MKQLLEIKKILGLKVSHQEKISMLDKLKLSNQRLGIIDEFRTAETLLIKKDGLSAAEIYGRIARLLDIKWLFERQARTLAKYAYADIGGGTINKSFEIYTKEVGLAENLAWKKIAEILKSSKGYAYAAQCYLQAGLPLVAAKMCRKALDFPRAGLYFEKALDWKSAALMYRKAGLHDKAGECFKNAGELKSAVREWQKAGTLEKHNIGPQTMHNILRKKE